MSEPVDRAYWLASNLGGCITEAIGYGIFISLCIRSISILAPKEGKPWTRVDKVMLATTIALFVLLSTHMGLQIARAIGAFALPSITSPLDSAIAYITVSDPKYLAQEAVWNLITTITDGFLIWRTYIVWQKRWVIVLPTISVLAVIGGGIGLMTVYAHEPIAEVAYRSPATKWICITLTASLITNVYCTAMIGYCIYRNHRRLREAGLGGSNFALKHMMQVLVESAALITVNTAISFFLYLAQTHAHLPFLNFDVPAFGISFCLIINRIRGRVAESYDSEPAVKTLEFGHPVTSVRVYRQRNEEQDSDASTMHSEEFKFDKLPPV